MNIWLVIFITLVYLSVLFVIAYYAERKKFFKLKFSRYTYALSIAVYCTAWTFYGSIGRATTSGPDFLAIYIGPILLMPLCWGFFRKIIKISKSQKISSIADFISARYGKNISLGVLVSLVCVIGIIPYISLQIKAIAESFDVLIANNVANQVSDINNIESWKALLVTGIIAFFIMLFGTSKIDTSERHEGLVNAIAFESIIKFIAFFIGAIFIIYKVLYSGNQELYHQTIIDSKLFEFNRESGYATWFGLTLLSMVAFTFLPRQFQLGVVENKDDQHLKTAMWVFPSYLILINLLVLPVAVAGIIFYGANTYNPDYTLLSLPKDLNSNIITLIVFIGGFSAATAMIIVETIALSTMLSNNILIPLFLGVSKLKDFFFKNVSTSIKWIRRFSILLILALAYLYYIFVAGKYSLVSIGLISFTAVAQFAPAVFFGIYWKRSNKIAAITSISIGIIIWFYTLVMPTIAAAGLISADVLQNGLLGIDFLKPFELFYVDLHDQIVHAFFWSMLFNLIAFVALSLFTRQYNDELTSAEIFVDIDQYSNSYESSIIRTGEMTVQELYKVMSDFLGEKKSMLLIKQYLDRKGIVIDDLDIMADQELITYTEKILSGVIGAASSRILFQSLIKEDEIRIKDVVDLLKESQQILQLNKELNSKSTELNKAYDALSKANAKLKEIDRLKDEFLYTVTHELRTPLTSVRAFAEIMHDHPDMEDHKRNEFLKVMVYELEKLSKLITQVLDLEKFESGKQKLNISKVQVNQLIEGTIASFQPILNEKHQSIEFVNNSDISIYADYDLLERVLINVIGNSSKYIPEGDGRILIRTDFVNNELHISVQDNGTGIPEEQLNYIFNKFYQVKNSKRGNVEGTGLGLSITKKIIDLHKGQIELKNIEPNGLLFIIKLPALSR